MVSKLHAFSGENPLISNENAHCWCDLDRGQTDVVDQWSRFVPSC